MSLGHICSESLYGGYCECFYGNAELMIEPEWEDAEGERHCITEMCVTHILNCINFLLSTAQFYEWCDLSADQWLTIFKRELFRRYETY